MKKTILSLAALLALNVSAGFAAPINNLDQGQTAIGITIHNTDPGSDTLYIEHQLSPEFTLGVQSIDWDRSSDMTDIYGQIRLNNNTRAIVGNRDFSSTSKFYLGMAVNSPLSADWDGYASYVGSSLFKELQVGANYKLSSNADFNLNYRSYMPDYGNHIDGVGFGASLKF